MENAEFQELVAQLGGLSEVQREALLEALRSKRPAAEALKLIEARFDSHPVCGHCHSEDVRPWGSASGLKRYRCRSCERTFNALTGTPLAQLHRRDAWLAYGQALVDGVSLRKAAKRCRIDLTTSFRWRHRFLSAAKDDKAKAVCGIVEADETFFLRSEKGSRRISGRAPRKRGGSAKKRGLSDEQVPVLIVRDRSKATSDVILPDLKGETIAAALAPIVAKDALLVSDGAGGGSYRAFAEAHGILHVGLNATAGERTWGVYHIQNVNAYASGLKAWMRRFRGVAFETVGIDLAVRAVNGAKKLKLIILDACRDNPLVAGRPADGKSRSFGTGLAPIETAGDVLVSYAAAAGKVALDGAAGDNSPFAKALVNHLRVPGVDVRQVLGRVRDDVKRATGDKQQPFIYASLGGDPIYLIPPPDLPPRGPSPVVVDLTMADPEEDAVKALLGEDNDQFRFAYDLELVSGTTKATRVRPRLDYFVSAEQRGRPLIEALDYGYFAPEEFTMWSVSYPLLDIIARRNEPKVVTLSDLVVEVEQSASDPTPYVGLVSPSDQFGRLVLFNEGWSDVRRATLEYDVRGFEEPSRQAVEALTKTKRDGGYAHRASVGAFQDFAFISLTEGLSRSMPSFAFYSHAFRNQPTEFAPDGLPRLRATGAPRGYAEWARANPHVFNSEARGRGVWVVGRMIVEAATASILPMIADFVAAVPIYPPEGLGGGAISYNLKDRINIRTDGVRYTVRKSIGYLLDNDTKTFRGLFPLTADRTSKHRLRFLLKGDGGQNLWTSDWIDMHIVVPRLSKKSAEWKGQGRAPFRGLR